MMRCTLAITYCQRLCSHRRAPPQRESRVPRLGGGGCDMMLHAMQPAHTKAAVQGAPKANPFVSARAAVPQVMLLQATFSLSDSWS